MLKNVAVVVALFVVVLLPCTYALPWNSCGSARDHFKIINVTVSPDPPVRGKDMVLVATGVIDRELTAGISQLQIKYGVLFIEDLAEPLCENVKCPVAVGTFSNTFPTVSIGEIFPNGKYTGTAIIRNQDNEDITCISFTFNL